MTQSHAAVSVLWLSTVFVVSCALFATPVEAHTQQNKPVTKDPYAVLGLPKTATHEEITKQYRKMALQVHPDRNKAPDAQQKFRELGDAYSVLGDRDKRQVYDSTGGAGFQTEWEYQQQRRNGGKPIGNFYKDSELIVSLTQHNWNSVVGSRPRKPVLVEFYAPWCIHCQQSTGEWRGAAVLLDGVVVMGAVNCEDDASRALCYQNQIPSYPAVRLFLPDGSREAFQGIPQADALVTFVNDALHSNVEALSASSFLSLTRSRSQTDFWIVVFSIHDPNCGFCQAIMPHMRQVSRDVQTIDKIRVRVGILYCDTAPNNLCARHNIPYYPLVRIYGFIRDDAAAAESGAAGVVVRPSEDIMIAQQDLPQASTMRIAARVLRLVFGTAPPSPPAEDDEGSGAGSSSPSSLDEL